MKGGEGEGEGVTTITRGGVSETVELKTKMRQNVGYREPTPFSNSSSCVSNSGN